MPERHEVDLLIIGAGPVGLFAAYYAGFRALSVGIVDSLPEIGGQISAMYPEKQIMDVAGFPMIKGRDLVKNLGEQADHSNPTYLLERTAISLTEDDDAGTVTVGLDDGAEVVAKAVIITAGIGKFTPRELPAANEWEGDEIAFFVPSFDDYVDRDVVIVGGGDSAFDWALHLEPIARSITLIHRRDAFRAHQHTVDQVMASSVNVITSANVSALVGDSGLEAVDVESVKDGSVTRIKAQRIVAALGFIADLSAMADWGLELDKRHIVVDSAMKTNLSRVFAAGDIVEYPGKVRLIAVGFGEAATAVNNSAVAIDPSAKVFPGHSSEGT